MDLVQGKHFHMVCAHASLQDLWMNKLQLLTSLCSTGRGSGLEFYSSFAFMQCFFFCGCAKVFSSAVHMWYPNWCSSSFANTLNLWLPSELHVIVCCRDYGSCLANLFFSTIVQIDCQWIKLKWHHLDISKSLWHKFPCKIILLQDVEIGGFLLSFVIDLG